MAPSGTERSIKIVWQSGRTADIAVGEASFVAFIPVFHRRIRTGPELDDTLPDTFFFVGYDFSIFHIRLRWVTGVLIWPSVPSATDAFVDSGFPFKNNHDSENLNPREENYEWQKTGKEGHNGLAKPVVFW